MHEPATERGWIVMRLALAALVIVTLAACAARPRTAESPAPPNDLAISVTVFAPAEAELEPHLPRWRRPARYILEPDWVLRSALGAGAGEDDFPPPTRRLDAEQVRDLWRIIREGNLLRQDHPAAIGAAEPYRPPPGESVALISISHRGQRAVRAVDLDQAGDRTLAPAALVDRLAELSWVRR